MPEGGTLTVSVGVSEVGEEEGDRLQLRWPGRYAWVEVSDTGRGMTREEADRAFDPLYTTKEGGGGAGMGLSLVYRTARDHGGAVHLESEPGRGSRFRLYLPVVTEERGVAPSPPREAPRGEGTILVADDESEVRRMGVALLEALGYTALSASDGEEAVRVFRERSGEIDLVLLDLVMPKKGGRETLREIRAIDPDVPALLTSGYPGEMERGERAGEEVPFLRKPYGMAELASTLRYALSGRPRKGKG
jgi:CheY-like chemotaxis protein